MKIETVTHEILGHIKTIATDNPKFFTAEDGSMIILGNDGVTAWKITTD